MRPQFLLPVFALVFFHLPATAQWKLDDKVQEVRASILEMTGSFIENPDDPMAFGYWNQLVAAAGREDLIATAREKTNRTGGMVCNTGTPLSVGAMIERAQQTSIVIVAEDHAQPVHRIWVGLMAESLKKLGYTYYAAETFAQDIETSGRKSTNVTDGYYTNEPVFAGVLEDIRALGYTLVTYEETEAQAAPTDAPMNVRIATREQAQTDNLLSSLLTNNPDAKVLIHVGHAHVYEFPKPDETVWMAARLKAATGIDPLTISLGACKPGQGEPILARFAVSPDGDRIAQSVDYYAALPAIQFKAGRPTYRLEAGARLVKVPIDLLPADEAVLIEARPPGADDIVVPRDRLYLRPGETLPLMLKAGEYELRSFDRDGLAGGPVTLSVSDGDQD